MINYCIVSFVVLFNIIGSEILLGLEINNNNITINECFRNIYSNNIKKRKEL